MRSRVRNSTRGGRLDSQDTTQRIDLHLRIKVASGREDELLAFLRRARRLYEAPGGIRVRLLRSLERPGEYIELVEYGDRATYERDQVRVDTDPALIRTLDEWRSLLEDRAAVEAYEDITGLLDNEELD